MNTVVTTDELEMLKAAMIDYKMNYIQLEITANYTERQ